MNSRHAPDMIPRKLIVLGASAGGVVTTCQLMAGWPVHVHLLIMVVVHFSSHESMLPRILSRCCPLPATHPYEGESIRAGRIYVAPPNRHLVVEDGHMKLSAGPRENRTRPAIDPLFRSAARAYRSGVIGI